jgi:hypothetical protein
MVPDLIAEHPAVKAVDDRIAGWTRRKEEFEQRVAELGEAAEEKYKKAAKEALLTGGKVPTPPAQSALEATVLMDLRSGFGEERQRLDQARQAALAEAFPDIVSEATKLSAELIADAAPLAASLRALFDQEQRLLDAVRAARWAHNEVAAVDPQQGRRAFRDGSWDFAEFVRVVEVGGDPIGSVDVGGPPKPLPHRRLGMVS